MPSSAAERPEIYPLSLHDALPICFPNTIYGRPGRDEEIEKIKQSIQAAGRVGRSEEHTSELQSLRHLVCRLLLRSDRRSTLFPYTTLFRSAFPTPFTVDQGGTRRLKRSSNRFRLQAGLVDRKSTRLNSSHLGISYAVFCCGATGDLPSFPTRRSSDLLSQHHLRSTRAGRGD